ncbi:Asp23/Gls24 family envelope stress response protein [Lacticaseibacillus chiayiensis]|uniref:Stress response regulator gls24 homolog n=1 Tax=Lacticaseibacillus chiayiensis TaxID=2100821 RepID=A0ABY6H8A8_9LACO|nr:Asp23/Gls24 family envelope stress response protein [Lacticaseibacillus chiayiensis]QVI34931.1 Asp23/Gls24 family envelope stress response protein [Lacticaseibacillus chiayiensis]UYN56692.1 Asp23/Gls24 family envelope stress response protein [Lacticaseibacillus chiayiensis]
MDNNKQNGIKKELKFDDAVIAKIVGITCNEVEGVYSLEGGMMANITDMFTKDEDPTKGVSVDLSDDKDVSVSLDATVRYGENVPDIFNKVTMAVAKNVRQMTGLNVTEVKMTVKDMLTREEIARNEAKDKEKDNEKEMQPA